MAYNCQSQSVLYIIDSVVMSPWINTHQYLQHSLPAGIITFLVPCYTAGKNAEAVDESCIAHGVYSLIPLLGIYCHAVVRGKIRDKKGIDVSKNVVYATLVTYIMLVDQTSKKKSYTLFTLCYTIYCFQGTFFNDIILALFCPECALIQEAQVK